MNIKASYLKKLQEFVKSYFELRFSIPESTLRVPIILKVFQKIKSRKLKKIGRLYLEARFATPESTLTAPNYSVVNYKFQYTI